MVKNLVKAVELYRKAAEKGHARAQFSLGFCYEHGQGVTKDKKKAFEWYGKSAAQKYKPAQEAMDRKNDDKVNTISCLLSLITATILAYLISNLLNAI